MKAAFLDRDGTIIADYTDEVWPHINEPEFLPGARDGLTGLLEKGFQLIIITNQYLNDEGFISKNQYLDFWCKVKTQLTEWEIPVLDIFYCSHRRDSGCLCCKPAPGMIEDALRRYPEICLEDSFFAGDRESDLQLAQHFGLRFFALGFEPHYDKGKKVESLQGILDYL